VPSTAYSRFTAPDAQTALLHDLPEGVTELAEIAERQTIHHNLMGYFGLSLLNHDLVGVDEPDDATAAFVRGQTYDATSQAGLSDLDELATLMSTEPAIEELVAFYPAHERLRMRGVEADPYSFVFNR
jgi:hypothetical protein